jgi:hypothetical protein
MTAARRKQTRKHSTHAPFPGFSRASGSRDTSSASRAVYSGRDRQGSFRHTAGGWQAVDRLGRPLGVFPSESQALDAIEAAAEGHT